MTAWPTLLMPYINMGLAIRNRSSPATCSIGSIFKTTYATTIPPHYPYMAIAITIQPMTVSTSHLATARSVVRTSDNPFGPYPSVPTAVCHCFKKPATVTPPMWIPAWSNGKIRSIRRALRTFCMQPILRSCFKNNFYANLLSKMLIIDI